MDTSFANLKPKITKALTEKFSETNNFPGEDKGFILLDGFIVQSVQTSAIEMVLGGTTIPFVVAVGKSTGRAYFFALKALLPDLSF